MPEAWRAGTIFTVGHSTRSVGELIVLLRDAGVDLRTVRDAELHNPVERLAGARVGDDLAREVAAFHRDPRDRAPDQTDADQRKPSEERLRHESA